MDEATKAKLRAAGLEGIITAFEKLSTDLATEKTARTAEKTDFEKKIAEKDTLIDQKNKDLVGARKETQSLKALTEEEKTKMSEREIAHHNALLQLQNEKDLLAKEISDRDVKEVTARRGRALDKIVGNKDAELRKKVEDNFGKIVGSDKAQTDEEIAAIVGQAFNMLGIPKPDPVQVAVNGGGGTDGGAGGGDNFSDSKAGKELSAAMNLPVAPAADAGAAK